MYRSIFCVFVALAIQFSPAQAHESPEHAGDNKQPTQTASGVVYHDANNNQKRDADEAGIPKVRVSNGANIVLTDETGRYEIEVDNDDIVFVIKPRDWVVPLNAQKLPQFYYIHKPAGSPEGTKFAGVPPTGPLPDSIDFPMRKNAEPEKFKAILFGDPQPRDIAEVEYIEHDVIEQIIAAEAHDAAFGVTLGDIVFDDLAMMDPLNRAIALIGIPWYNVIGNHDVNTDAPNDELSDETFERIYGPAYYSFDHGPTHFLVLDDVMWHGRDGENKAHYHGGLGPRQMEFIKNDLSLIPENQLIVLLMHVPLTGVDDRQELYRLIEKRPATVSVSAHTHYMEHRYIGKEDGWQGKEKHHHIVNVTVCGSWWRGRKDERGIPHATMSDGGPNGYSIMEFDGANYSLELRPAGRTADYQMNIYAPEVVAQTDLSTTVVRANVFNGSHRSKVSLRVDRQGQWQPMERVNELDPAFVNEKKNEVALPNRTWTELPGAHRTPHIWRGFLPVDLSRGSHLIEIKSEDPHGKTVTDQRIIRVETQEK
ncbi:calcineurin-like phosphoesterase C-terminal domain-containing protein [Planctomycetes bacterium K23_9]|uniref:Calcineurin-like phosphoesterase n=1 Tax=Stieleria marina TaxID=1930275 RepID=A0A517NMF7_9BACT|nr:Calcineurin-like phosphoesterase [Planctomycetes bacterium K23_9]